MAFNLLGKAVKNLRLPTVDYLNAPTQVIPVQQGDTNSRFFEITLYDDRGTIPLSVYTKAVLNGATPIGVVLTSQCEIQGSKVVCKFGGGLSTECGRVPCNITLYNTDNSEQLTSQTFYVIVYPSQAENVITENNEDYNQLQVLMKEIANLESQITVAEQARVTAENGRVSAEQARVNAESARASAEATRASNEATRQSNEQSRQTAETGRATAESSRVSAEKNRVTEYDAIKEEWQEAIDNINEATEKAAFIQEIYGKMNVLIYFDEDGRPCWETK